MVLVGALLGGVRVGGGVQGGEARAEVVVELVREQGALSGPGWEVLGAHG